MGHPGLHCRAIPHFRAYSKIVHAELLLQKSLGDAQVSNSGLGLLKIGVRVSGEQAGGIVHPSAEKLR